MKRSIQYAFIAAFSSLLLTSCCSPQFMVDDDVYVLKNNKLPIGESLNDETSYSSFRNNRENNSVSSTFYDDEFLMRDRFHRDNWLFSMGYGNPYYSGWMFGSRPNWGIPYYSPYMYGYVNPIYMYDPFGSPYGFYPTAYNSWYYGGNYGYGPYGGFGNQYGNNQGFNFNTSGTYTTNYNHHSGPRGSGGGFGNPNGRLEGNTIKSLNNTNTGLTAHTNRPSIQRKVENTSVIGENFKPRANNLTRENAQQTRINTNYKPTSNRGINNPSSTYSNEPRGTRPSSTPQRSNDFRQHNGDNRLDTPSRSNGGGSINNGGGRSGGSPANSGGRRN
jgi:hypothetical protein